MKGIAPGLLGAGDGCDCGCNIYDSDCDGVGVCDTDHCSDFGLVLDPNDNTQCLFLAEGCAAYLDNNDGCDCGCDVLDSDCPEGAVAADCEFVHCGGPDEIIDPADITQCIYDPSGGACFGKIGAGDGCDCGCNQIDPDCDNHFEPALCTTNHCSDNGLDIDPFDTAFCSLSFQCDEFFESNGQCDCGCGVPDSECDPDGGVQQCQGNYCPPGEIIMPGNIAECVTIAPTCDPGWFPPFDEAQTCSCGCGIVDPDCSTNAGIADCVEDGCEGQGLSIDSTDISQCL